VRAVAEIPNDREALIAMNHDKSGRIDDPLRNRSPSRSKVNEDVKASLDIQGGCSWASGAKMIIGPASGQLRRRDLAADRRRPILVKRGWARTLALLQRGLTLPLGCKRS
jgi:hypothetical protein